MVHHVFVKYLLQHLTILCRPMEFIECDDPTDLKGNKTKDDNALNGCYKVHFYNGYEEYIYFVL